MSHPAPQMGPVPAPPAEPCPAGTGDQQSGPAASPGIGVPSSLEWEAAARGFDGRLFPWGDQVDTSLVNCADSWSDHPLVTYAAWREEHDRGRLSRALPGPVDAHPGNTSPFGVRELGGNVWEWTSTVLDSIDSVGNPEECRDRSRAAAVCAYLVAGPALPGRGDPGVRLLHGRPARRHPGLCPDRHRACPQARPRPRSNFASDWGMDRPASPQPADGPRRAGAPGQVHDPGPRLELHGRVQCGPRRCRDPDRALQRPDAPHERHR